MDFAGPFAAEEIAGPGLEIELRGGTWPGGWLNLHAGQRVDPHDTKPGPLQGSAAAQTRPEPFPGPKHLIGACGLPVQGAFGGHLHFAFHGEENADRVSRSTL